MRDSPLRAGKTALAAILLLTLGAYWTTLSSSFHFDDYALFADPHVTAADGWWRVFRPAQSRPLTYFTFWINYQLGKESPRGYHAVNLAIHLAAVLAAWSVFGRLLAPTCQSWRHTTPSGRGSETLAEPRPKGAVSGGGLHANFCKFALGLPAAILATAIFALHPLQSEAVAYVFARSTLLATLLCLLSWRAWLDGRPWRAAAWFALSLLAKEESVAFPLFLLVVDWLRGQWRRQNAAALTAMLAAATAAGARLLYLAARVPGAAAGASAGVDPLTYLLTQPNVILSYFAMFLVPFGQNLDHQIEPFEISDALSVGAMLVLAAIVTIALRQRRRLLWLVGTLVLLAPTSSFIPLADFMFEHRMYLPLIGLSAGVAAELRRAPALALAVVVLAMTVATAARARVWSSERTLWEDAVEKSPAKVRPKLQLARAVMRSDPHRAQSLLLEARRLEPANPETFTQLGTLYLEQKNPAAALAEFDQALTRQARSPEAHSNRGVALYLLGRSGDAETAFRRALDIDPAHRNARQNLDLLLRSRQAP